MPETVADPIWRCLDRAQSAERRAALTPNAELRFDYERLAWDWRQLASQYEFNDSLERFMIAIEQVREAAAAVEAAAE